MKTLHELYDHFQASVMSGDNEHVESRLKAHPRLSAAQQMDIYQYGYRLRLSEAVTSDYPALGAYIGEKHMAQMASAYMQLHPSESYNLDRYSLGFADWFAQQAEDAFAIDLARLEQAIADVFMMQESAPINASLLMGLSPEEFGALVLRPRAASRLMEFSYPVHAWLETQRKGDLLPVPEASAEYMYIYRHNNEVKRAVVSPAAFALLEALASGMTVGTALDKVTGDNPQMMEEVVANLQSWFGQWLSGGFFTHNASQAA
jgi:hypothetical protein